MRNSMQNSDITRHQIKAGRWSVIHAMVLGCLLLLGNALSAQRLSDHVMFDEFNKSFLRAEVIKALNQFRVDNNVDTLKEYQALNEAADNQSVFMRKQESVTHDQPGKNEATPQDRAITHNALFSEVSETVQSVAIGSKSRIKGSKERIEVKQYKHVIQVILGMITSSPDKKEALLNQDFNYVGVGLAPDAQNEVIYVTILYGNEPYEIPEGAKIDREAFGLEPFDKNKCGNLERDYPYLAELLSDNIYVEDGNLYFYFHDLHFFQQVIKEAKDGIAIDIVQRDQYRCGIGNRIYPSNIHQGVLLKPLYKSELFRGNEMKADGELWVSVAQLPSYADTLNSEFNLLLIKDGSVCQTIYYNNIGGTNLDLMNISWAFDTVQVSTKADSVKKTLEFDIPFEQGKYYYNLEDIKPILDAIQLHKYDIKEIELTAYSSIEGSEDINKELQNKRAESILDAIEEYKLTDVNRTIVTKENWEGFLSLIGESPYAKEFEGLTHEQIRKIVNSDTLDYSLEPYLRDQRKAHLKITVESVYMDSALARVLVERMHKAVEEKDGRQAKLIQSMLLYEYNQGNIGMENVLQFDIPQIKELLPVLANQVVLKAGTQLERLSDSMLAIVDQRLIALKIIEPENPFLNYNQCLIDLIRWSRNYNYIAHPDELGSRIRKLYATRMPNSKVTMLLLNFNIIAAEYYYENKMFKERDDALEELRKFLVRADLDRDQTYMIANYFIFQMKLKWAIELMLPIAKKPDIDEDFLFTFITIAIYDETQVPQSLLVDLLNKAKELDQERFCKLFGYPNMSFQLLSNKKIKSAYCSVCNEGR